MSTLLLHCADVHLGYQQYNSPERYNDFACAFRDLVQDALARQVRYVLLAGDLFHKRTIDPRTLYQASRLLRPLKEAGIPVFAVEGNHERPHYHDAYSWIDYLSDTGSLVALSTHYEDGQLTLAPWDDDAKRGAYVDLPEGIRIIGVKYYGATTPRVIRDLAAALDRMPGERPAYTVLMLHAGLQGILDSYSATLQRSDLDMLRPHVDYVALGHIHKPFSQDGWIYNPGSLETNSVAETEWEERGYLCVSISPGSSPPHTVAAVRSQRREFLRLSFAVDSCETPSALYASLEAMLRREAKLRAVEGRPVAELRLVGILPFDRLELDTVRIERLLQSTFRPVVCLVRDLTAPNVFEIRTTETMTRTDLERHVLSELFERDMRRRTGSERWAELALRLKGMALSTTPPEEIVGELRRFRGEGTDEGCQTC